MDAAGIHPIRDKISSWQATIAGKGDFCIIYKLCVGAEQIPGMIQIVRWWYQDVVNEPEE